LYRNETLAPRFTTKGAGIVLQEEQEHSAMSPSDQTSVTTVWPQHFPFGGAQRPARRMPSAVRPVEVAPVAQPYCPTRLERAVKRTIDIVGALTFFALFGPLYLIVAAAVLIGMGGPVHYWQTRLGRGGRTFRFYKFRSMVHDSDDILRQHLERNPSEKLQWDKYQKLEVDPRVTRVGRVIRKLSLDELPQFFNVLKGDMSLVGPRPCMVRQRSMYGEHWKHYCHMRPGITGLWQVSGRNRLTYADRVALDARYAQQWSLWLDLRILVRTVWVVLSGDGSC
jgi:lipopolysaccharide/colanic/teichoic acid biosynthesis glycosyltransferase